MRTFIASRSEWSEFRDGSSRRGARGEDRRNEWMSRKQDEQFERSWE